MNYVKSLTLGKMYEMVLVAVVFLALSAGFGLLLFPQAAYADDDRFVTINGIGYDVDHDGNGPHIHFNGMTYYLEGDDDHRFVVVNGMRYNVLGDSDDDDDDSDDDDDDDDD